MCAALSEPASRDLLAGTRGRTGQAPFHKIKCPAFAGHLDQLSMLYAA